MEQQIDRRIKHVGSDANLTQICCGEERAELGGEALCSINSVNLCSGPHSWPPGQWLMEEKCKYGRLKRCFRPVHVGGDAGDDPGRPRTTQDTLEGLPHSAGLGSLASSSRWWWKRLREERLELPHWRCCLWDPDRWTWADESGLSRVEFTMFLFGPDCQGSSCIYASSMTQHLQPSCFLNSVGGLKHKSAWLHSI